MWARRSSSIFLATTAAALSSSCLLVSPRLRGLCTQPATYCWSVSSCTWRFNDADYCGIEEKVMKFVGMLLLVWALASPCAAQAIKLTEDQSKQFGKSLAQTVFYACGFGEQLEIVVLREVNSEQWVALGLLSDAEVRRSVEGTTILDGERILSIGGRKAVSINQGVATNGTCQPVTYEFWQVLADLIQ
jgi:hypothetical protein